MLVVQYNPQGGYVTVWGLYYGTWTEHGSAVSVSFAAGDVLGASALANGTVEVYKNGGPIATRSVTSWAYYASGDTSGSGRWMQQRRLMTILAAGH